MLFYNSVPKSTIPLHYSLQIQPKTINFYHQTTFNPLNAELNHICHLLALLGSATIVVLSRLRVKVLSTSPEFYIVLNTKRPIL
jgi:hypothetical protein